MAFVWGAVARRSTRSSLSIVVLIGIMGRESTESVREWWSRLGAWLGIYASGMDGHHHGRAFMARSGSAFLSNRRSGGRPLPSAAAGSARRSPACWLGTRAPRAAAGGGDPRGSARSRRSLPPSRRSSSLPVCSSASPTALRPVVLTLTPETENWAIESSTPALGLPEHLVRSGAGWSLAACLAAPGLLAWRVDINEFSLNEFYRSRLEPLLSGRDTPDEREPQNFTGFDEKDDMPLAELAAATKPAGPLHIVNCALNLGGSSDLALHTRHCASFTLTPYARELLRVARHRRRLDGVPKTGYGGPGPRRSGRPFPYPGPRRAPTWATTLRRWSRSS